jgi:DNA-binding transcriptional ArsR family regulator
MRELLERAHAYLAGLEAERQAALVLSEQKAEEAKLIKARQEGFQAAMAILGGEISIGTGGSDPKESGRRRDRRPIRQMILRELSFSGEAMTAAQIARAISYNPEGTETALERLEKGGQVLRDEGGRWGIGTTSPAHMNGHAVKAGNSNSAGPSDA